MDKLYAAVTVQQKILRRRDWSVDYFDTIEIRRSSSMKSDSVRVERLSLWISHTTAEHVVAEGAEFITHWLTLTL